MRVKEMVSEEFGLARIFDGERVHLFIELPYRQITLCRKVVYLKLDRPRVLERMVCAACIRKVSRD